MWKKWSAVVDGAGGTTAAGKASAAGDPDGQPMRTWTDATGTFKVEAAFLKSDGTNVDLKTADGREISVPISRLSASDQAAVKELSKPAGPENPFE